MSGPEARIQHNIQRKLTAMGVFVFKVHGSALMMSGLPDLICCVDGEYLGLEVKTPETQDDVSPKQAYVHDLIRHAGGECHVVWTVEQAARIVDAMRRDAAARRVAYKSRG